MNALTQRAAVVAAAATLAALPLAASAAVPAQDATFAMKAAQAGMTEVKLAAVALQKSKNTQVDSFARRMNADHSKANDQLTMIMQQEGLTVPSGVGAANEAVMAKLEAASGSAFDSAYLNSQLPAHQKVLALFKQEVSAGKDPQLVAFAKKTIPVIEEHIAIDKRDIAKVGSVSMRDSMPMK